MKNTATTTTIKMTAAMKSSAWKSYNAIVDALIATVNYAPDAAHKIDCACSNLTATIKAVHGVEVDAPALWSNVLIRLVSYKTRKADGKKWVKFNGIASFNTWVKTYKPESAIEVESKAGNDPSVKKTRAKKSESLPTSKEVAVNILKSLPEEERLALLEQLLAA